MTTWFTSDMHYGHANIIEYSGRPFADVDEMREALVLNWNSIVSPDDIVYIVGDAVMGHREMTLPVMKRLTGHKRLVPGNHDDCHPMYENKSRYASMYEAYCENIGDIVDEQLVLEEIPVRVCHFPYFDPSVGKDSKGRDYSTWMPRDDGMLLFCGHEHEKWKTARTPKGTLMLNVGVDVRNFRPVALEELLAEAIKLGWQS